MTGVPRVGGRETMNRSSFLIIETSQATAATECMTYNSVAQC